MRRVLAFGTFDLLHPGHLTFLKQAKRLGDELVVVIARDAAVEREKGRRPRLTAAARVELVAGVRWVDRVIIGDPPKRYFSVIRRWKPDVIVVGYDQVCDIPAFQKTLSSLGLTETRVVRLKAYKGDRYHARKLNGK